MKQYHKMKSYSVIPGSHGFTLVELMLAMLITGIIVAAIYAAYVSQQRIYLAQEQVAEMQQNIRAAIGMMTREVRMAGYDPNEVGGTSFGFTAANANMVSFSSYADDDGIDNDNADGDDDPTTGFDEPGELKTVQYDLYDPDGNGVNDLGRQQAGSAKEVVAENFESIEFYYTLSDGSQTLTPAPLDLDSIRSVQISLLARAGQFDRNFTNAMTYTTASGIVWDPPDDKFRRRLLITTVNCRNMGL